MPERLPTEYRPRLHHILIPRKTRIASFNSAELNKNLPPIHIEEDRAVLHALFTRLTVTDPGKQYHIHNPASGEAGEIPRWFGIFNFDPNKSLYLRYLDIEFDSDIPSLQETSGGFTIEQPQKAEVRYVKANPQRGRTVEGIILPVDAVFHVGCVGDIAGGATAIYGMPEQNPPSEFRQPPPGIRSTSPQFYEEPPIGP